jgi:hypothetical protein
MDWLENFITSGWFQKSATISLAYKTLIWCVSEFSGKVSCEASRAVG